MGIADLVPGISGGTIALITGIYDELIHSINSISTNSFIKLKNSGFKTFWNDINGKFLFPVLLGIIFSIFSFSKIIQWLMINESISLWSFFFTLTISSFLYIIKKIGSIKIIHFIFITIGTIFSLIFTFSISYNLNPSFIYIFFSGFLAITAMILPGISGAYILLILGVYSSIINSLNNLQNLIIKFDTDILINSLSLISTFFIGALLGLKIMSKYISLFLKKYPKKTLSFLLGLMLGSIHKIWPWQNSLNLSHSNNIKNKLIVLPYNYDGPPELINALFFMILGSALFFILSGIKKRRS